MKWHYVCPKCGERRTVEWDDRDSSRICHKTKQSYTPPTPAEQFDGYVDTHEWPVEMEDVVVRVKGKSCTVPGCQQRYQTLDHRVPWSKAGKTSVNNLFPMCNEHNQSKSDSTYETWLLITMFGEEDAKSL